MNRKLYFMLLFANLGLVASGLTQNLVETNGFYVFRGVEMEPADQSLLIDLFSGLQDQTMHRLEIFEAEYGSMSLSQVQMLLAETGGEVQAAGVQEAIIYPQSCIYRHCGNTITDGSAEAGITDEFRAQLADLLAKYE